MHILIIQGLTCLSMRDINSHYSLFTVVWMDVLNLMNDLVSSVSDNIQGIGGKKLEKMGTLMLRKRVGWIISLTQSTVERPSSLPGGVSK